MSTPKALLAVGILVFVLGVLAIIAFAPHYCAGGPCVVGGN